MWCAAHRNLLLSVDKARRKVVDACTRANEVFVIAGLSIFSESGPPLYDFAFGDQTLAGQVTVRLSLAAHHPQAPMILVQL